MQEGRRERGREREGGGGERRRRSGVLAKRRLTSQQSRGVPRGLGAAVDLGMETSRPGGRGKAGGS